MVNAPHSHHHPHTHHNHHENNTGWVVLIAAVMMLIEVTTGFLTHSMALLSDGFHMGSHVLALGLAWFAYFFISRNHGNPHFVNSREKILALSGYTSAIVLVIIALVMAAESVYRLYSPVQVDFKTALLVATLGLGVNLVSAYFLHHPDEESDHNIRAAYIHVLSDTLTSVAAIFALLAGYYFKWYSADAISGILSSILILFWAWAMIRVSAKELVDYK